MADRNAAPATVPFQPRPLETAVSYVRTAAGAETIIARVWPEGGPRACRLCAVGFCAAGSGRLCQVRVPGYVPEHAAEMYGSDRAPAGVAPLPDDPRLLADAAVARAGRVAPHF